MIYTPLTKKAQKMCFDAHKEQVDKSGLPYVFHPFHLAEQMDNETATICALLHDVVEDTDTTFDDIKAADFPSEVIEVLRLLTHDPAVPYMDYVRTIATNPIARQVKIADLRHNSDVTRLDRIDDYTRQRFAKYAAALEILGESK